MPSCLCLHGYLSSAATFETRLSGVKKLAKEVEFKYVDAPYSITLDKSLILASPVDASSMSTKYSIPQSVTPLELGDADQLIDRYGWYLYAPLVVPEDRTDIAVSAVEYFGGYDTYNFIESAVRSTNPKFILAFSQASTVIINVLYQYLRVVIRGQSATGMNVSRETLERIFDGVTHVCLCSPFFPEITFEENQMFPSAIPDTTGSRSYVYEITKELAQNGPVQEAFPFKVTVAIGQADPVVPPAGILHLQKIFPKWNYIFHDGKHVIPKSGAMKHFFRDMFSD